MVHSGDSKEHVMVCSGAIRGALLAVVLLGSAPVEVARAGWTHTNLLPAIPDHPTIAVDPLGHVHIVWRQGLEVIRYFTNQHGGWFLGRGIATEANSWWPTVTGDALGFYHVTWRDEGQFGLYPGYATNHGGLESPVGFGYSHTHETAVEVDSAFNVHVFTQADAGEVSKWGVVTGEGGQNIWHNDYLTPVFFADGYDVQQSGNSMLGYSTAIDSDDVVHIVTALAAIGKTAAEKDILYTFYENGSWAEAVPIMALDGQGCDWPGMAADALGSLHVVATCAGNLHHVKRTEGEWSEPLALTTEAWENLGSVAVDPKGAAHVVWFSGEQGDYHYANNVGGAWSEPELIVEGPIGSVTQHKIAIDWKSNTLYIVYGTLEGLWVAHTQDHVLWEPAVTDSSVLTPAEGFANPTQIPTSANSEDDAFTVLEFVISDSADDGLATHIEQVMFPVGSTFELDVTNPADGSVHPFHLGTLLAGAVLEAETGETLLATVHDTKLIFGQKGQSWSSVESGQSKTYHLDVWLKETLPVHSLSGKIVLKVNGLYDVVVADAGSGFATTNLDITTETMSVWAAPEALVLGGLQDNFFGENLALVQPSGVVVQVKDSVGNLATSASEPIVLSALLEDGSGAAPGELTTSEEGGLTQMPVNGTAIWEVLSYSEPGAIRIRATSGELSVVSEPISVFPTAETLVVQATSPFAGGWPTPKALLADLGKKVDVLVPSSAGFPPASKLEGYGAILVFGYQNHSLDSLGVEAEALLGFLQAAEASNPRGLLLQGRFIFLPMPTAPEGFLAALGAESYETIAAVPGAGLQFQGVEGDPISDGFSTPPLEGWFGGYHAQPLQGEPNAASFLTEVGTGLSAGVRHEQGEARSAILSMELDPQEPTREQADLLARLLSWFSGHHGDFQAVADAAETASIAVAIDVLQNDVVVGGQTATLLAVLPYGLLGQVEINEAGTALSYMPPGGFTGTDSFAYVAGLENGAMGVATVDVTVTGGDVPPAGGDCCEDTKGIGCQTEAVQACVCDLDPGCCAVSPGWDAVCVDLVSTCPGFETMCDCEPECSGKECGADGCGGDCGTCMGDLDCDADGRCLGEGDCCEENGSAGCEDEEVQDCVCALDAGCCESDVTWDNFCVEAVEDEGCGLCGAPPVDPDSAPDAAVEDAAVDASSDADGAEVGPEVVDVLEEVLPDTNEPDGGVFDAEVDLDSENDTTADVPGPEVEQADAAAADDGSQVDDAATLDASAAPPDGPDQPDEASPDAPQSSAGCGGCASGPKQDPPLGSFLLLFVVAVVLRVRFRLLPRGLPRVVEHAEEPPTPLNQPI
jgi:hypothetical protein